MKKRIVKEWIVYLVTGVLFGILLVRSQGIAELDALLILASASMLILTGFKIQQKEAREEMRAAYSQGVKDAWQIQEHEKYCHTFMDDE